MTFVRTWCLILVAGMSAGCWDFFEPEFAAENAAAVIQLNASLSESGDLQLTALLMPGVAADGFVRVVTRDSLYVFGIPMASDTTMPSGSRAYSFQASLGPALVRQPFTIDPPELADLPPGPTVRWYSPRSLDPDTLRIARGGELRLHIEVDPDPPSPMPTQQWFIELNGRDTRFQIGANGAPPAELQIPANFIPEPADSVIHVMFTSFQSAQLVSGLYRAAYTYLVHMDWTIILQ